MIFLGAAAWDYRIAWHLPFASATHLGNQHLAPALHLLSDGDRRNVLTDQYSALLVKAWTDDDVVYTSYVRHLLMSNEEFAERYCLSEVFSSTGADEEFFVFESLQYRGMYLAPERRRMVRQACRNVRRSLAYFLDTYAVELILWNEKSRPDWIIDPTLFEKTDQGEGWSLWKRVSP